MSVVFGFLGVLSLAVFLSWLAFALGRWLGRRDIDHDEQEQDGPVGSVVTGTLALLAFTLAIGFNMAHTKYSGRKALVRADVKAIQMAYDRAMLLPPDAAKASQALLAEYARIRAFDPYSRTPVPLGTIIQRSMEIQDELWLQAVAHRERTNVRFYMDAVSNLKNVHAERVTMGVHDHVPLFVWICLAFVTALGMLTMGYRASIAGSRKTTAMFPLFIAFGVVFCLALDLDLPQQGILRIDQSPMHRLADALEAD